MILIHFLEVSQVCFLFCVFADGLHSVEGAGGRRGRGEEASKSSFTRALQPLLIKLVGLPACGLDAVMEEASD